MRRLQAERESGVVDQQVNVGEAGGQRGDCVLDRRAVTYVEFQRQGVRAQLGDEPSQTLAATVTCAPSAAKRRAMAAPKPALAPVTKTIMIKPRCESARRLYRTGRGAAIVGVLR
jgi:hypothetical protein